MALLSGTADVRVVAQEQRSLQQERAAIGRLHEQDIEATLSDKADVLAQLWDRDAVRLSPRLGVRVGVR